VTKEKERKREREKERKRKRERERERERERKCATETEEGSTLQLISIQLRFGKRDSEMLFAKLAIVHSDEANDGFLRRVHRQKRHLLRLVEKLELMHGAILAESSDQVILADSFPDVGQVKSRARLEDVRAIFRASLLVAVERRVGVVLGEAALAGWVIAGHGDVAVLRDADVHGFSPNHELIQMLTGDFGHPWVGHLDQGRVLFIEKDLHPNNVSINAEESEKVVNIDTVFVQIGDEQNGSAAAAAAELTLSAHHLVVAHAHSSSHATAHAASHTAAHVVTHAHTRAAAHHTTAVGGLEATHHASTAAAAAAHAAAVGAASHVPIPAR